MKEHSSLAVELPQSVGLVFVSVPAPNATPFRQLGQPNICKKWKIGVVLTYAGLFLDFSNFSFFAKPIFMWLQNISQVKTIVFTEKVAWKSALMCVNLLQLAQIW